VNKAKAEQENDEFLRERFQECVDALVDSLRSRAAGKWIEVRQGSCVYAINASRIAHVAVYENSGVKGLNLRDTTIGDGWFITHVYNNPATIESWLQAVEG